MRRAAARALGESRSESAAEPLMRELLDGASDIRSEAAEALGRLGFSTSIDPLVDALSDADPRVRISAIRGLASLRGDEVHELLFWQFGSDFDPLTFPTLVDVLGERQDRRIVRPALGHLTDFPSRPCACRSSTGSAARSVLATNSTACSRVKIPTASPRSPACCAGQPTPWARPAASRPNTALS